MGIRLSLLILLLAVACAHQTEEPSAPEVTPEEEKMESSGVPESDVAGERTGGCWEQSCISGNAHLVYIPEKDEYELRVKNKRIGVLPLSKESEAYVEKISLLKTKTQYVLIYQAHDGESAGGRVDSFDQKTLQRRWSAVIPGFNLGFAAKANALYVSCIGFAGKLDLRQGKYLWKLEGLYEKHGYNGPDYIRVYDKEVRFISGTKVIKVNPKTGKLIP